MPARARPRRTRACAERGDDGSAALPQCAQRGDIRADDDIDSEPRLAEAHRCADIRFGDDPIGAPIVGEAELDHHASFGQDIEIDAAMSPPHRLFGVELPGLRIGEDPARAPIAEAEHDRAQVLPGGREVVLPVNTFEELDLLELAKPLGEQRA